MSTIDSKQKISIEQMGWVFEQLDMGVPFKSLAIDLNVDVATLRRRHQAAIENGFSAFMHPGKGLLA